MHGILKLLDGTGQGKSMLVFVMQCDVYVPIEPILCICRVTIVRRPRRGVDLGQL